MVIFMLVLIGEQFLINRNDVSSDTGHLVQIWTLFSPGVLKITLWLNPTAQNLESVARLHLLETCLQSDCCTHTPSQAGKFWSPRVSLVMINFSRPSVMKCWPFLAISGNKDWRTRWPTPASWNSEDLGQTEENKHPVADLKAVSLLSGKQDRKLC